MYERKLGEDEESEHFTQTQAGYLLSNYAL